MSLKSILKSLEFGIALVQGFEDTPIEPFVSTVVLELNTPVLYGMVGNVTDLKDCLHSLDRTGFRLWSNFFPTKPTGDSFTSITFKKTMDRYGVLFTLSIPNPVLLEYHNPTINENERELDF